MNNLLPEFLRQLLPSEDEAVQPELSTEEAKAIVQGPTLHEVVASDAPLPPVQGARDKLMRTANVALDKLAAVLGLTTEEIIAHPHHDKLIAAGKLHLQAAEIALRTTLRSDENILKARAVDTWPKLKERLEKARIEARQLQEERLAQDKGGVTG